MLKSFKGDQKIVVKGAYLAANFGHLERGNAERELVIMSNIACKHSLQNAPS